MTPLELLDVVDARLEQDSLHREFLASLTATLMRAWVKQAPRHTDLLGEGDRQRASERLARHLERDERAKASEQEP